MLAQRFTVPFCCLLSALAVSGAPAAENGSRLPAYTSFAPSNFGHYPLVPLFVDPDGSLYAAWQDTTSPNIIISCVVQDRVTSTFRVPSLGRIAGFARDGAGNSYVLTSVANDVFSKDEWVKRDRILQLLKVSPTGEVIYTHEIGDRHPVYNPMCAGSARIAFGSDRLGVVFSQNIEYDAQVGARHQAQSSFVLDAKTGAELGYHYGPSHSFDERVIYDRGVFVGASLGDAFSRGIQMIMFLDGKSRSAVAYAIKGTEGDNNTYSELGQIMAQPNYYSVLFATDGGPTAQSANTRNLAYVRVRKDFDKIGQGKSPYDVNITEGEGAGATIDVAMTSIDGQSMTGHNRGVVWLTNYTDQSKTVAYHPRMAGLANDALLVMWEEWHDGRYAATYAVLIDGNGVRTVGPKMLSNVRLDAQDDLVVWGGSAMWAIPDAAAGALKLYAIDDQLTLSTHMVQAASPTPKPTVTTKAPAVKKAPKKRRAAGR